VLISAHQCSSEIIRAYQCSSVLISAHRDQAHQWPSVAIRGTQWHSVALVANQRERERERERELSSAHLQPWCTDAQMKRGRVSAPPKSAAAASSPTDPDTYASMFFTHAARS